MHPEVTGKQGEECSKCGMELTEPVTKRLRKQWKEIIKKASHRSSDLILMIIKKRFNK
jgi:hypothetical protein